MWPHCVFYWFPVHRALMSFYPLREEMIYAEWKNSSICMIPVRTMCSQHFFRGKLSTLYLNCTSCVPNDVSFDENTRFIGTGWNFSSSHCTWTLVTACESVCGLWLPCCLIAEGLHLLFGPFCSRSASFCVIASPGDPLDFKCSLSLLTDSLWWARQNNLNGTTCPSKLSLFLFFSERMDPVKLLFILLQKQF